MAAADEGVCVYTSGTPVMAGCGPVAIGDHPRYRASTEQYRAMLDDFSVCAVHVHIGVPDREVAVLVGNHLRPWLPLLVAMSANSPFHYGRDTGYADWRTVIRSRFPCLGPPPYAQSLRHHEELAVAMAESEAMLDVNVPLWDLRPNPRLPTLEIRAMDVMADVDRHGGPRRADSGTGGDGDRQGGTRRPGSAAVAGGAAGGVLAGGT